MLYLQKSNSMKKAFLILSFLAFQCMYSQPQAMYNKAPYNFWINYPKDYNKEDKTPLILFLHGKSLSGNDLNRVKRYGIMKGIEKGLDIPAIVIAPQLPNGPWDAHKLNELIEYVSKEHNIDESRIYVTGMSLGSYGTTRFVGEFPDKIAAAVSICGGGVESDACNLSEVPLKIIHGDKDFIVPLSESKKIVNAIKKCKSDAPVEFEIVKGGNHGSVEDIYRHQEIYDWLLKHQKETKL